MSTPPALDRSMALQMVKMFDELYRRGINDCIAAEDDGRCHEFLEATAEPGVYGLLTDDYFISAREWQLRLQLIAGRISLKSPMYRLFCMMGNYLSNYLGCFLPLASDFYRKGISDALMYGHKLNLTLFNNKTRAWLTEKGLRSASNDDYKNEIQQMCYNRKRAEQALMDSYTDVRRSKYQRIGEDDVRRRVRRSQHWESFVVRISSLTKLSR